MKELKPIIIPKSYNYIGVFLTLSCNLNCHYCINNFLNHARMKKHMSGADWVKGLNRIVAREDLPITLQGGEPTLHKDFYYIVNNIKKDTNIDLLTNIEFDIDKFIKLTSPNRIKRASPYASIRVSYHPSQMNIAELIEKVKKMLYNNYSVGIWGLEHPHYMDKINNAKALCREAGIDYRTKEFLGFHENRLFGTYKYTEAIKGDILGKKVTCKTTELLINSDGNIYRCHSDLYNDRKPIGHILDPNFEVQDVYRECDYFGTCNPCDIKVKTNRFQKFGHTSVDIKFSSKE